MVVDTVCWVVPTCPALVEACELAYTGWPALEEHHIGVEEGVVGSTSFQSFPVLCAPSTPVEKWNVLQVVGT